jgi:hypothetical protein
MRDVNGRHHSVAISIPRALPFDNTLVPLVYVTLHEVHVEHFIHACSSS